MAETRAYISYTDEDGSVNVCDEVISILAASAATEVEGVYALYPTYGRDIGELLSKKALARSVKIDIDDSRVTIDLFIIVELGAEINVVAANVQKSVAEAVESSVGSKPEAVNVHVCGISLKKSK